MTDFMVDGQPFETPIGAASESYLTQTPPSFGSAFKAEFGESSTTLALGRWLQRGVAGATGVSGALARGMTIASGLEGGMTPEEMGLDINGEAQPSPVLSADEANKQYAPPGTKITDQPIPEAVARLVGKAKADEITRQNVIARFSNTSSGLTTFGTGMAAFLMDPINAASMFIPGVGEETALAGMGKAGLETSGALAHAAAGAISGAATGAIGQAPLSLAKWAMGQGEASDYDLRSAFRDMLFSAAGGAVIGAALGGGSAALRSRIVSRETPAPEIPATNTLAPEAAQVLRADALTKSAARQTAISQVAEGRPIDVMPIFDEQSFRLLSEEAGLRQRGADLAGFLQGVTVHPEAEQATETLARLGEVERQLASPDLEAGLRKQLATRRDELMTNTNPETLREQALGLSLRQQASAELARVSDRLKEIQTLKTARDAEAALSPLPKVAEAQGDLYRNGFAQGIPQGELDTINARAYGEGGGEAPSPATPPERAAPPAEVTGEAVPHETDPELAEAERQLAAMQEQGHTLLPEEQAELAETERGVTVADLRSQAMQQAGQCLAGAAE